MSDIRNMKKNGDVGLKQAEEAQAEIREKKVTLLKKEMNHFKQNERFLNSTGITLQEKSFRNMVDYNKFELLKILKSDDQHAEIIKLPKSIQRTLKKNGVITKRWRDNEITERAEDYLTIKNPSLEL
jgi:hemerythrin